MFVAAVLAAASPTSAQSPEQKAAASAFIDALIARNFVVLQSLAHQSMHEKITPEQWKALIDNLESKAGSVVRHSFYEAEMNRSYANIVHRIYFQKDSIGVRVVVDSLNFVGGFWLDPIKKVYLFPAPPYADTTAFYEENVSLADEFPLPAVISVPKGSGPFPAVVLVHGSGPQDRDQTIGGNKVFRDIAWGLASRGVMVLRYDKRTKVHGPKMNLLTLTIKEETIDDAIMALAVLRKHKLTDTTRLMLLGHSLGAAVAPEIATMATGVKGVIMLAPIARPLEVVISDQLRFIAAQQDTLSEQESVKLHAELQKATQIQEKTLPEKRQLLGAPASYYYDLQKRDQKAFALGLHRPIFIARGEKDYQAPQMELVLWKQWLQGVSDVTFKTYPNCYHIFIPTDAKPGPWNYSMEGHVTVSLIEDLGTWCKTFSLPSSGEPPADLEYKVR